MARGDDALAVTRRLADLEAIRDLARRYAHCVWQGDAEGAVDLFAGDGVMDMGDRPALVGRDALLAEYRETLTESSFRPFVHHHVVELGDDPDAATGTCYLDLKAVVDGRRMEGWGWYDDEYVRRGGRWLFRSRRLRMEHYGEAGGGG